MTFIRGCLIVSLIALLCVVLYLPAAYAPSFFYQQIAREHVVNTDYWGAQPASAILERLLRAPAALPAKVPLIDANKQRQGADPKVRRELDRVGANLFHNDYLKALDGLLALATFRGYTLAAWLAPLLIFGAAALFDGGVRRVVKSREFSPPSAEAFSLSLGLAVVVACATALAMVLPLTLPPWLLPLAPPAIAMLLAAALANYHRLA